MKEIVIIQNDDGTFDISYMGIERAQDVKILVSALEKDVRKRRSAALSFSENWPLREATT